MQVLKPNVAGMFYPDDPYVLKREIASFLGHAKQPPQGRVKAIVAPHAGYIYSGPVAASAYHALEPIASQIRRVILLAPSHRYAFQGLATTSADALETPLGTVPVDKRAVAEIASLPQVQVADQAFVGEHALEVQLPFLETVLGDFDLVPLIVGDASPREVADVLDLLWGGDETLIVVSSDLSHYHDYDTARARDQLTAEHIEHLEAERIRGEDACGARPLNGLLLAAREHGLKADVLDLRNSGDTAGDKDRVVGYGAFVFTEPAEGGLQ